MRGPQIRNPLRKCPKLFSFSTSPRKINFLRDHLVRSYFRGRLGKKLNELTFQSHCFLGGMLSSQIIKFESNKDIQIKNAWIFLSVEKDRENLNQIRKNVQTERCKCRLTLDYIRCIITSKDMNGYKVKIVYREKFISRA